MDKREQTRKVRQIADLAEKHRNIVGDYAMRDVSQLDLDALAAGIDMGETMAENAVLCARNAVAMAVGGTTTCQMHAARAERAAEDAEVALAALRRAVEVERLRRVEADHAKRTMLERDHPALAAVVACAPGDTELLDRAVALVRADDYRSVHRALDSFGVGADWDALTLPGGAELAAFINEDTDARELAGVIAAHVGFDHEENAALAEILDLAEAAGWRAPGVAFGDDPDHAAMLADWEPSAVYGGDDDHVVAEAAALAVARYGVFDDVTNPEDCTDSWWAWIAPGVPVWLPHVEAWRKDMPVSDEVHIARQIDRSLGYWEEYGRDDYLCAYAEAYVEAILDAETPATLGEEWDSGISTEDRRAEAVERAEAAVDALGEVSLGDLYFDTLAPDTDDFVAQAEKDARADYRQAASRARGPINTLPLF